MPNAQNKMPIRTRRRGQSHSKTTEMKRTGPDWTGLDWTGTGHVAGWGVWIGGLRDKTPFQNAHSTGDWLPAMGPRFLMRRRQKRRGGN